MSDRVLYDILIQAGRVIDLYIPRDKETDLRLQNTNLQRLQTMPSSFSLALCPSTIEHRTILLITVILRLLSIKCTTSHARKRILHKLLVLPDGIYTIKVIFSFLIIMLLIIVTLIFSQSKFGTFCSIYI